MEEGREMFEYGEFVAFQIKPDLHDFLDFCIVRGEIANNSKVSIEELVKNDECGIVVEYSHSFDNDNDVYSVFIISRGRIYNVVGFNLRKIED